jgi:hypothetical protein
MDDIASLETSKPLARELFDELVLLQRQMNDKLDISSARP